MLRTTGTVDWDNDHTTQAITQVSGPITRILVDTGARVKKGDVLLYVSSPDVSNAISAYRKAKNRLDLAQHNLDRNKDLLEHKAISQRDFESAQADYNDAATDVQTSLEALRIFGVTAQDITDAEHQNVGHPARAGDAGAASPARSCRRWCCPASSSRPARPRRSSSATSSTLWVQGHIYEKDLPSVHIGDAVEMRNSSFPVVFHGTVSYIGDMIDPATRTTPVRIVTRNSDGLLKKDLFLDVDDQGQERRARRWSCRPRQCSTTSRTFRSSTCRSRPGQFAQRQITIGAQQQDQIEILDGVKEGEPRGLAGQRLPAVRQQLSGTGAA